MIRKGRARWVSKGDPLAQLQFIDGLFGLSIMNYCPALASCESPKLGKLIFGVLSLVFS